jgi:hypothetical protein
MLPEERIQLKDASTEDSGGKDVICLEQDFQLVVLLNIFTLGTIAQTHSSVNFSLTNSIICCFTQYLHPEQHYTPIYSVNFSLRFVALH